MYTPASESLIKQAREIKEDELQRFCGRVYKLLQTKDVTGEAVDSLQRLRLIVSATKYGRELPSELTMKLHTALRSSTSEQLQTLSSAIIRESFPPSIHSLSSDLSNENRSISHVASVILAQAAVKEDVMPLCHHLLRSFESRLTDGQIPKHALPVLCSMISGYPHILTD
ncbi:hypothetical protein DNTS_035311, partial [Danionella cerebrum]